MKNRNVILASIIMMALVTAGVGAGTMAWFSTAEKTTGTFTMNAATMSMDMISAGPYTFDNLVPGQTFGPIEIQITNTGTMNIKYLAGNLILDSNQAFADKIEVTSILEYIPGSPSGWYESIGGTQHYETLVQDGVAPLTLLELAKSYIGAEPGTGAKTDQFGGYVNHLSDWVTGGNYDQVPTDAISVGGTYHMKLTFKFSESAGNDLQHATCTFRISFLGLQDLSENP
jgi:predicted ribosomally synthesized peptide with SipW-like signal peptide